MHLNEETILLYHQVMVSSFCQKMERRSFLLNGGVVFCIFVYINFSSVIGATLSRNETDHLSLKAFKDAITEDPFGVLSSWNDSFHFCEWEGVSCGSRHTQRVVSLNLDGKNLRGTFSPYVGNLSFLKIINVSNNFFVGEIPIQLSSLFRLQVLILNNNSFTGEIPANLSYCTNLRFLRLANNMLGGSLPVQLGLFPYVNYLDLGSNSFTGEIPSSIGNMSSLVILDLGTNNLVGTIPSELSRLQRLEYFGVNANHLSGIVPPQLYNHSNIRTFSVSRNTQLQGSLPAGLNLPNLEWLAVGGNQFSGTIPVSLLNCSKLSYLEFSVNQFSGPLPTDLGRLSQLFRFSSSNNNFGTDEGDDLQFLSSLTNCTYLQLISVGVNSLKGSLPTSIGNFSSNLEILYLGNNHIHGNIPSGIRNLVNLNYFDIKKNNISGSIPEDMGELRGLQKLYLNGNKLTGRIPFSLGNLTQLNSLFLGGNKLDGSIPPSIGKCQNLIVLDLSYNNLTGKIPIQLFDLHDLSIALSLAHNSLTGPLPLQVGKLNNLVALDVSDNRLSGDIPRTLGECVTLAQLFMKGNLFEGTIPGSLSALRGLQEFDMSHNNLTGLIPEFLGKLPFLYFLDLSFNDMEGAVSKEGIFKNASGIILDGNHKLCGGISQLGLPVCLISTSKRNKISVPVKVIAPVVVAAVCLIVLTCLCILCYKKGKATKKLTATESFEIKHPRISYAELMKATDNFSETNLLGFGTYGHVYKGILDQDGLIVAVKVLNLQHHRGSKSFMAECTALRNVRHRNLVKILTSCSSVDFQGNDFKALVFQFMPNGNLEKWLYPEDAQCVRNVNIVQRLSIAIDIASALDYLHHHLQSTIVHCDLKPSNILLDSEMTAHVGDFGLAKVLSLVSDDFELSQTNSFAVKGTVGYVAPEYGLGNEASTQGDVYSYGILLLEMFTGKRPTNEIFKDGLSLHRFVKISLPEKLEEIIDPCLLVENRTEGRLYECLAAVMKIGVTCSMESPMERMQMGDVVVELISIRAFYEGVSNIIKQG